MSIFKKKEGLKSLTVLAVTSALWTEANGSIPSYAWEGVVHGVIRLVLCVLGKEDYRGKVLLSSHYIKCTHY